MIPCRTIWLFANKVEVVSETAAPFDWGEIQSVNIHGVWIMGWVQSLGAMGQVGACILWSRSLMHQGNLSSYLPLETEVGSFLIPAGDGGGDIVHGLNSLLLRRLHNQ